MTRKTVILSVVCPAILATLVATPGLAVNQLVNPGFELGSLEQVPQGWSSTTLGPQFNHFERRTDASYAGSASGTHININPGGLGDQAFMYQQVPVQAGTSYTAQVRFRLYSGGLENYPTSHTLGIGVDPNGGNNWSAASVVKKTVGAPDRNNWYLLQLDSPVMATGGTMTFFLYSFANLPQGNGAWWGHYFDEAVLDGQTPSVNTPTPTPTRTPACLDTDRDGLCDSVEGDNINLPAGKTNRLLNDSDGDGSLDGQEDTNGNGARDIGETNARGRDSDGDQYTDGIERLLGTNPLLSNAGYTDNDADELPDANDPNTSNADTDGDRIKDGYDAAYFQSLGAANNAGQRPPLGDGNGDTFVTSLDALITQSLFLQLVDENNPVFNQGGPNHLGFRYLDVNRDAFITSLDALVIQSFFLNILSALPL